MAVLVLLILWPVAEIYAAIRVAEAIGVPWTLLLLIVSWPVGLWAMRTEGRAAWRRLGDAVAAGRPPGREVLNGALVLAGGVLLLIPGFISDIVGVVLLLPPSRALLRGVLGRNLDRRIVVRATGATRPRSGYDVDSTATDVDPASIPSGPPPLQQP